MSVQRFPGELRSTKHDGLSVLDVHGPIADGHTVGEVVHESHLVVVLAHPIGDDGNGKVPVQTFLPGRGPGNHSLSWHDKLSLPIEHWGAHASVAFPPSAPVLAWVEVRTGTAEDGR